MIKFLQVADSLLQVEDIVKRADAIIKQAEEIAKEPTLIQHVVTLLEIVIWPLTLIASLLLFKNQIASIFDRFKSAKVTAQGLEFTLLEKTLEEAESIIPIKSNVLLAKDGGGIISKDGGGILPKDGQGTMPKTSPTNSSILTSHADTPYLELLALQEAVNQKLLSLISQSGITHTGSSNYAITSDLEQHKIINHQTANQLKKLIELLNIGLSTPQITYDQVIKMKKLFINISI